MSFTTWLASLRNFSNPQSKFFPGCLRNRARRGWARRIAVEGLEERVVLSAFTVTNVADSGAGSFRQAILDANANPGADVIDFNIPGAGVHTIEPLTSLPQTSNVTIDATTQPGYVEGGPRLIELSGVNYDFGWSDDYGVRIGNDSTIRGLAINQFFFGIRIDGVNNQIEGNYIGTDPTGSFASPNYAGVFGGYGTSNRIGTDGDDVNDEAERNVISGNSFAGIWGEALIAGNYIGTDATGTYAIGNQQGVRGGGTITGNLVSGNHDVGVNAEGGGTVVQGNLIGTDKTGEIVLPNLTGVFLQFGTDPVLVGGTTPEARNVIAGNSIGVRIQANSIVQGNFIGRTPSGSDLGNNWGIYQQGGNSLIGGSDAGEGNVISGNGLGIYVERVTDAVDRIEGNQIVNNGNGIKLLGSINQVIGGTAEGAGNTITNNSVGILVAGDAGQYSRQNRIVGNSIFDNLGLGIDLSEHGYPNDVTPNDLFDLDTKNNELQNYPELTAAGSAATTRVQGSLHSTPNSTFVLDFYANSTADPSGFGEGERWLGSATVSTDADGNATFDVTVTGASVGGEIITATATDAVGNTSEFSAGVVSINAVIPVTVEVVGGTFTYDGLPHGATSSSVTATDGFSTVPTLTYYVGTDLSGPGSSDAPVDAGTYTVVASFAGDDGHYPGSASALITIDKADVTVSVTGGTFTYDGSAHGATSNSVTGTGGLSTTAELSYYSGATLLPGAPTNAGSYTVIASYAGDANHNAGSASASLTIAAKDLTATGSTQSSINISKTGTLTFTLSNVSGIVAGDGTVSDLFNGATFQLGVNGMLYSVTSAATVLADGTIQISWRMTQELYQDLYAALGSATPSNKTLVDFLVSGTSNGGNYTLTEDVFSRIFQQGKVVFS